MTLTQIAKSYRARSELRFRRPDDERTFSFGPAGNLRCANSDGRDTRIVLSAHDFARSDWTLATESKS